MLDAVHYLLGGLSGIFVGLNYIERPRRLKARPWK
jgi:hypothetical protein